MPASRSRTERWRDCLQQIYERNGGIEVSIARPAAVDGESSAGPDLVWRVRILHLDDSEMLVERPTAMGQSMPFSVGAELVGVMAVGQNRWMFSTRVLKPDENQQVGMRLSLPEKVERCRRRDFFRVSTVELHLPKVTCWPLLDPMSVIPAEVANRAMIMELQSGAPDRMSLVKPAEVLPEVGPPFTARLMNIGGGGVGLHIAKEDANAAERCRLAWLRIDLTPQLAAPIAMTAKFVHSHIDSEQNLYVGGAFDFSFHAAHKDFIVGQITRYVAAMESLQKRRAA